MHSQWYYSRSTLILLLLLSASQSQSCHSDGASAADTDSRGAGAAARFSFEQIVEWRRVLRAGASEIQLPLVVVQDVTENQG